ncbi:MAG: hypothetical protein LBL18_03600 [Bacteroidales bacterium]|jgi:hypothetical protein|nr:hypothetical protein [Bacteroidales bacterium]
MRKVLSLLAVLAACTLTFTACKKQCSYCAPKEPDAIEKISFDLTDKSRQAEFLIYKGMQDGYYRETASRAPEENLLQLVKEYCESKNIAMENPVFAFALYCDSLITQSSTVTDEHIQGVSVYDVKGRKITHHLFVRNENAEFYEVENVRVAVEGITSTHLHYYLKNYVFSNPQNKSWITIKGKFAEDVYKNIKKYYAPFRYEVNNATKAMPRPDDKPECNNNMNCFNFPSGIYMPCKESSPGQGVCSGTLPCATTQASASLQAKEMVESIFFDTDLMYAFRDDFLSKYDKGEEYIDNYYYLSEEYEGKISLSLALRTALFFKNFNPVMETFINPDKHLKEIMFTNELSDSLLNLLDEYEKITKSSEGKAILASIRKDIDSFRNKQLQDIFAMIK